MTNYEVKSLFMFCGWWIEKEIKNINKVWSLPFTNLLDSEKFQELMLNIYVFDVENSLCPRWCHIEWMIRRKKKEVLAL